MDYTHRLQAVPTTVRLGEKQAERLAELAKREQRSVAWLIRRAIESDLKRSGV